MSEENEVFLYIQAYLTKFKMMAAISIITSALIVVGLGAAGLFAWKFIAVSEEKISKLEERLRTGENDIKTIISDKNLQISDMQTKLVALASIIDSLDKDRMKKTYDSIMVVYNDMDKKMKAFASWAGEVEKNSQNNISVFNKNVKIYDTQLNDLRSQLNHLQMEVEKHRKVLVDIVTAKRY